MSREEFIDNLRLASRLLAEPRAERTNGARTDANIAVMLNAADLWLTQKAVAGFDPADFADLPPPERQDGGRIIFGHRNTGSGEQARDQGR